MKKKGVFLVVVICLVCLVWGVYKAFLLHYYKIDHEDYVVECLNNLEELSINTDKSLANTNYYNMNLYIPENLEESENQSNTNKTYVLDGVIEIWLTRSIATFEASISEIDEDKKIDYEKILSKYDITDRLDLIKYYDSHVNEKRNIFLNKSHLQMDYISASYIVQFTEFGKYDHYYYLTNGLSGLMKYGSDFTTVYVFNEDEIYTIRLNIDSFDMNEIEKILSSITFN